MSYRGRTFGTRTVLLKVISAPSTVRLIKGKAHYIVLSTIRFYVNRDYQYIGYIDERTFAWLEKDLS
ncbi:hypothetical protein NXW37_29590 [Bacteroides thetaiotaomicron]|nr:hypothetical protein [Bacteroides thetaiotaomicron]